MNINMIPELLAPCGSPEALTAALDGGADAVYFGGTMLNARMSAKNFNDDSMVYAVKSAHERGVRVFVTLNTLIFDRELSEVLTYAAFLYRIGVDALIIADLGLARILHKYLPDFELHASTQLSGHNLSSAHAAAEIGFSRMVCARELSYGNMKYLAHNSPIEIEAFVHGAHCVSHSGQCLFSSMVGGRSGNRGACAQPCRMKYTGIGSSTSYGGEYPLSLRDMCLAGHIRELIESGVSSLKIEGRMKSPSYVFSVVRTYRMLLDERRDASADEINYMSEIFSRSGFTDGYFTSRIDTDMLGVRSDTDKNSTRVFHANLPKITVSKSEITPNIKEADLPNQFSYKDGVNTKRRAFKSTSAQFVSLSQIPDVNPFDIVYLPLECFANDTLHLANGIIMPPVIFDSEYERVKAQLDTAVLKGAKNILIGNIGQIQLAQQIKAAHPEITIYGDFRLNITNSQARFNELLNIFKDIIVSPELSLPQIRDLCGANRVIVYGRIPLMLLERPTSQRALRDRTSTVFPIFRIGDREVLYNSVPTYMADKYEELKKAGVTARHFIFTVETRDEVKKIISSYQNSYPPKTPIRRI